MKRAFYFGTAFFAIVTALAACSGKNPSFFPATEDSSASVQGEARAPRREMAPFRVVLHAEGEFTERAKLADFLRAEYGDDSSGGMLIEAESLRFAEPLPEGSIVILVGADEQDSRDLARLRDASPALRVVSLFALAESLPLEALCDLVIDLDAGSGLLEQEEASALSCFTDAEIGFLLYVAALAFDREEDPSVGVSPINRVNEAIDRARAYAKNRSAGIGWQFAAYQDPETGLRAANHLVFSSKTLPAPLRPAASADSSDSTDSLELAGSEGDS